MDELPIDPDLAAAGRRDRVVLAAIALGAMPGAAARYGISRAVTSPSGQFPWATFWTNISGALVLGCLLVVLVTRFPADRWARPLLGVGFLGAYTTFSTFSVETDLLVKDGHSATAIAYVLASLLGGLGAVWAGVLVTRSLVRR